MEFHYDDKALVKLIETLKNDSSFARVGIIGKSNTRNNAGETNATIGVRHELGLGLPVRSFLRMPIVSRFKSEMKNADLINESTFKAVLSAGNFRPLTAIIGIIGERCVLLAFESGGFGKWQPSNMENKAVLMTLVETQQLRNSITSEVVE